MAEFKFQKCFRITESTRDYLAEKKDLWALSETETLERIVREHKEQDDETLDAIADAVINKFDAKYANLFTNLRVCTRLIDFNVQLLLDAMNSLLFELNICEYIPYKDKPHPIILAGQRNINETISKNNQRVSSTPRVEPAISALEKYAKLHSKHKGGIDEKKRPLP